ncbi:hypothetical protein Rhopal_007857-T1 [Rhodotorula paludigena]|uniref:Zn(2)-C6 fungal-type domain-containing protein n=1 Tax=Rhodotorula paludigena TaxID=86838 RepID=A0AAV5GXR3_9BASI|nr:hypothetical protein Rhopal_007857-T1 [Rhodotorula paludigena]
MVKLEELDAGLAPSSTLPTPPSSGESSSPSPPQQRDQLALAAKRDHGRRERLVAPEGPKAARTVPCTHCRRIRRVCRWTAGVAECERCRKDGVQCSGPVRREKAAVVKARPRPAPFLDDEEQIVDIGPSSPLARWTSEHLSYSLKLHLLQTCADWSSEFFFNYDTLEVASSALVQAGLLFALNMHFGIQFSDHSSKPALVSLAMHPELIAELHAMLSDFSVSLHILKRARKRFELVDLTPDFIEAYLLDPDPKPDPVGVDIAMSWWLAIETYLDELNHILAFASLDRLARAARFVSVKLDTLVEHVDRTLHSVVRHPKYDTALRGDRARRFDPCMGNLAQSYIPALQTSMGCLRVLSQLPTSEKLRQEAEDRCCSHLGAVARWLTTTSWDLCRFYIAYGNAFRLSNCLDVGWYPLLPRFAALYPVEADLYLVFPDSLYCEQY